MTGVLVGHMGMGVFSGYRDAGEGEGTPPFEFLQGLGFFKDNRHPKLKKGLPCECDYSTVKSI